MMMTFWVKRPFVTFLLVRGAERVLRSIRLLKDTCGLYLVNVEC